MTKPCAKGSPRVKNIHACLSCIYFGCFSERHIHEHAKENNHKLAIDTNYGYVFCFTCNDYQYDAEFKKISREQHLIAAAKRGTPLKWEPRPEDVAHLEDIIDVANIGLRGLVNMGLTCYLSVILQSLVHAPLFRDYFLSLQHKCRAMEAQEVAQETNFQIQESAFNSQNTVTDHPVCFVCEMSDIVQELFSKKEEKSYAPDRLLHLLWIREDTFKGQKQHDAHELLLALLHNLHLDCQGSNGNSDSSQPCKCMIDTIFTGISEYVYTCQKCRYEYSKSNVFKDLVLVSAEVMVNGSSCGKKQTVKQQTKTNLPDSITVPSLVDCLKKSMMAVVPETVCTECKEKQTFSEHRTLKKLPFVITFTVNHLHETKQFISFPEFLDMTPYTISHKTQSNEDYIPQNDLSAKYKNAFYLFAVVEHRGNAYSGHYICYIRRQKSLWFKCDDQTVERVSVQEVLNITAYLLFYHKETLQYEFKRSLCQKHFYECIYFLQNTYVPCFILVLQVPFSFCNCENLRCKTGILTSLVYRSRSYVSNRLILKVR